MNPIDIQHVALWWGPGIVVLMMFGYGALRLAHYWIEKSMEVKRQQLDGAYGLVRRYIEQFLGAQAGQADALSRLANSVEHRESQESFEHQEMLIALKALHGDIANLRCRNSESHCAISALATFPPRSPSADLGNLVGPRHPGFNSMFEPPVGFPHCPPELEPEREHVPDPRAPAPEGIAAKQAGGSDHN